MHRFRTEPRKGDEGSRSGSAVTTLITFVNRFSGVMSLGHERGRKLGYFAMCLSKLRKILGKKGYKVSEAQIRLIMKEISNTDGFEEMEFSRQKKVFMSIVSKYVRVSRHVMELAFRQADQRSK